MEKKKTLKINLSSAFLIIAIVVILIMTIYIYKCYNEKINETKEIDKLNTQVSQLQNTIHTLQNEISQNSEKDTNKNTINSENVENTNNQNNVSNENKQNSSSGSVNENKIDLKMGNYTIDEFVMDEAGVTYEECGVTLKENKEFEIYIGFGIYHTGKYEIKNQKLVCKSTILKAISGGPEEERTTTDVIFTFDIINDKKLKMSTINNNDKNVKIESFQDIFKTGMTYSIK